MFHLNFQEKMKSISLLFILSLLSIANVFSQCNEYFDYKPGMVIEMGSFNAKGKLESKQTMAIKGVQNQGNKVILDVKVLIWDNKDEKIYEGENKLECENGVFKMDMTSMALNNSNMSQVEGLEVKIEGDRLSFPPNISVGEKLPDAAFTLTMSSTNAVMNSMMSKGQTFQVKERKVEAKETVNTPAGAYECFKISSKMNTTMAIGPITKNIDVGSVDFLSKKYGVIRSESYDSKGKLTGYTEMLSIKN